MNIIPYQTGDKARVIDLALAAWRPVFPQTKQDVPGFVYDNFYPQGWEVRQTADVGQWLDQHAGETWLAVDGDYLLGFVGTVIHPDDRMGEISIIAVAPEHQKSGVGRQLLAHAEAHIREQGMDMVMVETVGDSGHEPARKAYESQGYVAWPVARYFKEL